MEIKDVKKIGDIKKGDILMIKSKLGTIIYYNVVRISSNNIVVIKDKNGVFEKETFDFSFNKYLEGKSWVKECKVIIKK